MFGRTRELAEQADQSADPKEAKAGRSGEEASRPADSWEQSFQIRQLQWRLHAMGHLPSRAAAPRDIEEDLLTLREMQRFAQPRSRPRPHVGRAILQTFTSLVLGLSVAALTCGLVLLGWSHFGNRPDLWDYTVPLIFGGQGGLLVGGVLYLELARRRRGLKFNKTTTIEGMGSFRLDAAHNLGESFSPSVDRLDPTNRWSFDPYDATPDSGE